MPLRALPHCTLADPPQALPQPLCPHPLLAAAAAAASAGGKRGEDYGAAAAAAAAFADSCFPSVAVHSSGRGCPPRPRCASS